jgi:hypothetical protein
MSWEGGASDNNFVGQMLKVNLWNFEEGQSYMKIEHYNFLNTGDIHDSVAPGTRINVLGLMAFLGAGACFWVRGTASSDGSLAANQKVMDARAQFVIDYLTPAAIDPANQLMAGRLTIFGNTFDRSMSRGVEILQVPPGSGPPPAPPDFTFPPGFIDG